MRLLLVWVSKNIGLIWWIERNLIGFADWRLLLLLTTILALLLSKKGIVYMLFATRALLLNHLFLFLILIFLILKLILNSQDWVSFFLMTGLILRVIMIEYIFEVWRVIKHGFGKVMWGNLWHLIRFLRGLVWRWWLFKVIRVLSLFIILGRLVMFLMLLLTLVVSLLRLLMFLSFWFITFLLFSFPVN